MRTFRNILNILKKRKTELLIIGAINGFPCKSCENMKESLRLLQKELLAKDEFTKSFRD